MILYSDPNSCKYLLCDLWLLQIDDNDDGSNKGDFERLLGDSTRVLSIDAVSGSRECSQLNDQTEKLGFDFFILVAINHELGNAADLLVRFLQWLEPC